MLSACKNGFDGFGFCAATKSARFTLLRSGIIYAVASCSILFFAVSASAQSVSRSVETKQPTWLNSQSGAAALRPDAAAPKIDASTQKSLNDSFTKVLLSLDDANQQKFASSMATIGVIVAEDKTADTQKKLFDIVHGKTADEIITAARKLTPYIKKYSKIIDGSSEDSFNRSLGKITVSLPLEKQGVFSEAVAKLVFQAQKNGITPEELRKKLDGKTAEEVVWLAESVRLPFNISNGKDSAGAKVETKLTPLTPSEIEKIGVKKKDETRTKSSSERESFDGNFSPNSLFEK